MEWGIRRMRQWWLWALVMGLAAGVAEAQSPADAVVRQLREQGYVEFAVTRTLLGRVRVVALAPDGEQREIVFNPATGEILRDYSEAADGSAAPRVLDRSDPAGGPQATSSPAAPSPRGNGAGDPGSGTQPGSGDDGNRGHGNDEGGDDSGNPGRGNGTDGNPGRGNDGNPSRGGGNGSSKD